MSEYSVKNIAKLPLFLGETNGGLARSFMTTTSTVEF